MARSLLLTPQGEALSIGFGGIVTVTTVEGSK